MAKIKKAIDWEGDFLNIYDQIERKDLSPSAIEHKWTPFGIKKEGTAVNAELLNDFQKNGIYGTLNTVKEIINGIERYIVKDFYGIEEFGVFEELKLKIKISDANNEDNPKLVLNGIEYSIIYSTETSFVNIKKGQLEKNKIYNLIFNGVAFIVESSSLKATADSSGLMSLSDVRNINSEVTGGKFSGFFGTSLTSAIKDNVYYYYDTVKAINISYLCILDYTKSSGILVPNTTNFIEIDNSYLAKKTLQYNGVNTFPGYHDIAGTRRLFFSVLYLASDGSNGTVANLPFPVKNILDMQCTDVGAGVNTTAISNLGNTAVRVWGKDSNGTYVQTLIRVEVFATI